MKTKIEWTDYTCNCFWGCTFGCTYCQARSMARRFGKRIGERRGYPPETLYKMREFKPVFLADQLSWIKTIKKPSRIFMSFMGEPFAPEFEDYLPIAFKTIKAFPEHTFQMLTKQPQNLIKYSPFPPNVWIGVSCTNWLQFSDALGNLAVIKAKVKFLSFEPLLERIQFDMMQILLFPKVINWAIIGPQTPYSKKTAPRIEWVKEIVEAVDKVKIPVFLKDNLAPLINEFYPDKGLSCNHDKSMRAYHPNEYDLCKGCDASGCDSCSVIWGLRQEFPLTTKQQGKVK